MELEEAIDICKAIKKNIRYKSKFDLNILKLNQNNEEAIETVLQALDNSIPKEKVKENIKVAKQTPRKEFCNYDDYTFGKIRALEKLLEE